MHWDSSLSRSKIRESVIKSNLLHYSCSECGITEWYGETLTLHLDHINGKNRDHRLDNLRWLCPNCHSLTPTYCGKNAKNYSSVDPKVSDAELLTAMYETKNPANALASVGLSGAGNYPRVYRLASINDIERHMSKTDKDNKRVARLLKAEIDTTRFGWVQKASDAIGMSPQKTRKWIQSVYPEFLENSFER